MYMHTTSLSALGRAALLDLQRTCPNPFDWGMPKMITSHAVTMLLLRQCLIHTHFIRVSDGKTRVSGLWREKKMHNVSEPYLMSY